VLERQQHVHHLLAVALLLDVGDLAVAAIGDAGLRDLARIDGVVLWMSSGRTMPATINSRISKLTRISCLPSTPCCRSAATG